MGTETMGKVVVSAKIENMEDLYRASKGEIEPEQVRGVEVEDAIVDVDVSSLLVPKRMIDSLGLVAFSPRSAGSWKGPDNLPVYGTVRLTIQGRDCHLDVGQLADDSPVTIGHIPLTLLDWVVDPQGQRLIGNPEHGGVHMIDAF
jgi:hypothetical protein